MTSVSKTVKNSVNTRYGKISSIVDKMEQIYRDFEDETRGVSAAAHSEANFMDNDGPIQYIDHKQNSATPDQLVPILSSVGSYVGSLDRAVKFKQFLSSNGMYNNILKLIEGYREEIDADDLMRRASENRYSASLPYGIIKWMMTTTNVTNVGNMRLVRKIQECIECRDDPDCDEDEKADCDIYLSVIENGSLLKRIQILAERLWNVLYYWPIRVPHGLVIQAYVGIGNKPRNANFMQFVVPALENEERVLAGECHNVGRDTPSVTITSNVFVSSSYSFQAACKFMYQLYSGEDEDVCNRCMIEILMPADSKLTYIGESTNEAEILFKPGDVFRYIRRYDVTIHAGEVITVYQYQLINDNNNENNGVDYLDHATWSMQGNTLATRVSAATELPIEIEDSGNVESQSQEDKTFASRTSGGNALKNRITSRIKTILNSSRKRRRRIHRRTVKRKTMQSKKK
jgi:hypothetical protein